MDVIVSEDVTSFFINGSIESADYEVTSMMSIDAKLSTAKENEHYIVPPKDEYTQGYGMYFPIWVTKSKIEIKIKPEAIKEPLTIVLRHGHYMALDVKNISEIIVNLIPLVE